MQYDLAIIGSGFAGLMVAKKAREMNLRFCVVAEHAGATQHFSGAFDVMDPRWQEVALRIENYPSLELALSHFIKAHPQHLYAQLAFPGFEKNLVDEILSFFKFYQIPVLGDGRQMMAAMGSMGQIKPTGFTLASQGLWPTEVDKTAKVFYVNFPSLNGYPQSLIQSCLQRWFSDVEILDCDIFSLNNTSPLAHILQLFDEEKTQSQFIDFLKNNKAKFIFMPPVLGIKNFHAFHQKLESVLGCRVIELLSILPSSSGLRVQECIKQVFGTHKIPFIKAKVTDVDYEQDKIKKIRTSNLTGQTTEIAAKNFILATGKYLGGGIERQKHFRETIFDLPLYSQGKHLSFETSVSQLIQDDPLTSQSFMEVGVGFKTPIKNLSVCGHVLAGFDFSRDRCGFGVSAASALNAIRVLS